MKLKKLLKKIHREFDSTLGWPMSHYRLMRQFYKGYGWAWVAEASVRSGIGKTPQKAIKDLRASLQREVVRRHE